MLYQGEYYITMDAIKNILNVEEDTNLYAKDFSNIKSIKLNRAVYYNQADVYAYVEEESVKDMFLKEVQACAMLALELTKDNKTKFANKLGFEKLGSLDSFLSNKTYTTRASVVLVKLWRNYKSLVKKYDKGDF